MGQHAGAVARPGGGAVPLSRSWWRRRQDMLPYYAYRGAEAMVGVLPVGVSYWLGDRVVDFLVTTMPRRLDPLRENMAHVLPKASSRMLNRTVRRNLRNLTHSWIDVMAMSSNRTDLPSRIDIDHLDNYFAARERSGGTGVVMASIHYGSWEAGLAAWNAMGHPMALLAEILRPQELFDRIIGARGHQGVKVIPIDAAAMREGDPHTPRRLGAGAMREVLRSLKSGVDVAMAIDRDLIGNGVPTPFFGKPAPIPVGVVDIAIRAGAPIVPVVIFREGRRIRGAPLPEIRYSTDTPRDEEVRRVTLELLALFERYIREHPDQWHVLDPIWRS
jgi:KDO2-lipid IV(A) lauroyltransferase